MKRSSSVFGRVVLALAILGLAGSSARAQMVISPRATSAAAASSSPISPFLFGPPAYPFRATAPSSYRGASLPDPPAGSGFYRGPNLSPAPLPSVSAPSLSMRSQPAIGAFIGFASTSSLLGVDSDSGLPGSSYRAPPDNRAHITLHVPADAEVFFDGKPTKQTGTLRVFDSPPLPSGKQFAYEVRVRWRRDGKQIEVKRRIPVEARDWLRFDLTRPSTP